MVKYWCSILRYLNGPGLNLGVFYLSTEKRNPRFVVPMDFKLRTLQVWVEFLESIDYSECFLGSMVGHWSWAPEGLCEVGNDLFFSRRIFLEKDCPNTFIFGISVQYVGFLWIWMSE